MRGRLNPGLINAVIALNCANSYPLSIFKTQSSRRSQSVLVNSMTEKGHQEGVEQQIILLRRQLLESERSWFPVRSRGLREELRQAEEQRKVSIFLFNEDEGDVDRLVFSRTMFEEFIVRDKLCLIEDDGTVKNIPSFDELIPDKTYLMKRRRQTFKEGTIQTRDTVKAIVSGQAMIPPFNHSDASSI